MLTPRPFNHSQRKPARLRAHSPAHKPVRAVSAVIAALGLSLELAAPAQAEGSIDSLRMPPLAGLETLPGYPAPVYYDDAPTPRPFPPEYLGGYISDVSSYCGGIYADVVKSFQDLRGNKELMQKNLDLTVQANNAAANDPAAIERAQRDAAVDQGGLLMAFSDALGDELGQAFRDALKDNRLPKTQYLLGNGYLARAGGVASSTLIEKELFGFDRPFVVAPDRIHRYESPERDFYKTSKSFPSGHTNQATWVTTLLAMALPEVGPQLLLRGAEAGYHRLVMGVHYPLDVIGGRMTGTAAAADRWNDPRMREALGQVRDEIRAELAWRTGKDVADVAAQQRPYRPTDAAVDTYTTYMTHGFAPVGATDAPMIVPQAAPDLLLPTYPDLSYEQRAEILRRTALPAGYPLGDQGPAGSWQRINLAAAMAADATVNEDGSLTINP
ncbi:MULTISPECIES: phosphatase PAP2 family protein [Corynebacterium]|uniref:acid phosphatase n=1 Tax=Corynebacterium TaxID=1716 RepID=UPI001CE4B03F|nr:MULTISPECIES: phosphatase PAP2 family protein [Corynebacterium]